MADAIQILEGEFELPDGVRVYQKTWMPAGPPVAKLIHFHGYSEHINRYYELFPTLAGRGIICTGIDQRGFGKSVQIPADRGNAGPTTRILSDFASFIKAQFPSPVPVFVMAHSMGACTVLTLTCTPQYKEVMSQLSGILLESPHIDLAPQKVPSSLRVSLARLASKLLPHYQIRECNDPKTLTRDPAVQESIRNDILCHNTGTLEMFGSLIDRSAKLVSGEYKLSDSVKAIWIAHGTGDEITSYSASKHWYETQALEIKDRSFKTYEGWSHSLHADLPENRKVFAADCINWILQRCT